MTNAGNVSFTVEIRPLRSCLKPNFHKFFHCYRKKDQILGEMCMSRFSGDRLKPGFEPAQLKTHTQTHVFTETAADSNQTI